MFCDFVHIYMEQNNFEAVVYNDGLKIEAEEFFNINSFPVSLFINYLHSFPHPRILALFRANEKALLIKG